MSTPFAKGGRIMGTGDPKVGMTIGSSECVIGPDRRCRRGGDPTHDPENAASTDRWWQCTKFDGPVQLDAVTVERERIALARANERIRIVIGLRDQAALRFDTHGPQDARGAAFWDAASWIVEDGFPDRKDTMTINESADVEACAYCGGWYPSPVGLYHHESECGLTQVLREVTDLWGERLDEVNEIPPIVETLVNAGYSKGGTARCGHVECDGTPVDRAAFVNPLMDHNNGENGFCSECLRGFADPIGTATPDPAGVSEAAVHGIARGTGDHLCGAPSGVGTDALKPAMRITCADCRSTRPDQREGECLLCKHPVWGPLCVSCGCLNHVPPHLSGPAVTDAATCCHTPGGRDVQPYKCHRCYVETVRYRPPVTDPVTRDQLREAERNAVLSALAAVDDLATDLGWAVALQHTRIAYARTPSATEGE